MIDPPFDLGPGALSLRVIWERKGKTLESRSEWFSVSGRGRVQCGYCGQEMAVKRLLEHYIPCKVREGDW